MSSMTIDKRNVTDVLEEIWKLCWISTVRCTCSALLILLKWSNFLYSPSD